MATPLTPARLLGVLRAEGLTVREYRSWRTHERDDETSKHFGPVRGVMCHHTGPYTTESGIISLVYNGRSGLPGPLAHGVIDNAGVVWLTSAGRANHAGGGDPRVLNAVIGEDYGDYPPAPRYHDGSPGAADGNDAFYGFECVNEGDGKDTWPAVQYTAMVKAHAALCRAYGWGAKSVIGHKEWSDHKVDPRGISMKTFRRDVAACLALPAGRWTGKEDDMALTDADVRKLANLDGIFKAPSNAADRETNASWTLSNLIATAVAGVLDLQRRMGPVEQAVAGMSAPALSDDQLGRLAAQVAADPTLAETIAERTAQLIAARLAE